MFGIGPLELMIILLVGFFLIGSGVFIGAIVWGMSHDATATPAARSTTRSSNRSSRRWATE